MEVDTEKVNALEANNNEDEPVPETLQPTGFKAVPEPYRSMLLMVFAATTLFGGGAAGQSAFGISEEKLEKTLQSQFEAQDKAIEARFTLQQSKNENANATVVNHGDDIRELLKLVRAIDTRVTKLEAKNGTD